MSQLEIGVVSALFLAVLGCYIFIFKVSNSLNHGLAQFKLSVTDRLARIEEQLKTIFNKLEG